MAGPFDPESPFGYRPPAACSKSRSSTRPSSRRTGTPVYADRAREILLTYGDYRSAFPEWAAKKRPDYDHGVPALPDFFVVMRYLRAYDILHRLGKFSPAEVATIEEMVGHSIDYLLQTSEWGTMNRTMLRAESLAWAVTRAAEPPAGSRVGEAAAGARATTTGATGRLRTRPSTTASGSTR